MAERGRNQRHRDRGSGGKHHQCQHPLYLARYRAHQQHPHPSRAAYPVHHPDSKRGKR